MKTSQQWYEHYTQNLQIQRVDWELPASLTNAESKKVLRSMQAWQLGETSIKTEHPFNMKPITKTILWLTVFSIAMGYLETSVVVYLRKIYYPEGFKFPLIVVSPDIAVTEFFREIATIIMLVGAGVMAGKNKVQRFVFFIYSFAIWDIFYYIFLKLLLNWPESLFTWDILFLIPVPWVGPVIAPCIVSLTMIVLTMLIVYFQEKGRELRISFIEWMLLITGSITCIISFMWDYIMYVSLNGSDQVVWTLSSNTNMFEEVSNYIPQHFNWWLFWVGEGVILTAIVLLFRKYKHTTFRIVK